MHTLQLVRGVAGRRRERSAPPGRSGASPPIYYFRPPPKISNHLKTPMTDIDIEDLRQALDDASIVFDTDPDRIVVMLEGSDEVMSESLSTMVDALLDLVDSPQERDDMRELARHFDSLARRIRRTIDTIEGNDSGE